MSAQPESNGHPGHNGHDTRVGEVLDFERDDLEIELVEGAVGDLDFPLLAELIDEDHSCVFQSYPYAHFEAALNGEMTPQEWARGLARHVDKYLLPN